MIVYVQGDIFESDETVIAHGCNCSGGFASGFAKEVTRIYPAAREAYLRKFAHEGGGWSLGDVQVVEVESSGFRRRIANCATQQRYGRPDQGPYVSYDAIRAVVRGLLKEFPQGLAMPKIGAGLAGGNWDIIEQIINEEIGDVEVRVYVSPKVTIRT